MVRLSTIALIILHILLTYLSVIYVADGQRQDITAKLVNKSCSAMDWFDKRQKRICSDKPLLISEVKRGIEHALSECRGLFKWFRWNCSPLTWTQVIKEDGLLKKRSRETAFVQALSAAGVMHSVAKACTKQEISYCGCGFVTAKKRRNNKNWSWGGCGHNIKFAGKFTKYFLDPTKIKNHARKAKAHNHEAGRKIVRENIIRKCKCHGKSQSCNFKTCWQMVPTMEKIGKEVWKRYRTSVKTRWDSNTKTLLDKQRSRRKKLVPLSPNKLSYFTVSENFCVPNQVMGIMGTSGRVCNHTSNGHDGCSSMCCGRKYKSIPTQRTEKCNCRFVWCCQVVCDTCVVKSVVDTCT